MKIRLIAHTLSIQRNCCINQNRRIKIYNYNSLVCNLLLNYQSNSFVELHPIKINYFSESSDGPERHRQFSGNFNPNCIGIGGGVASSAI